MGVIFSLSLEVGWAAVLSWLTTGAAAFQLLWRENPVQKLKPLDVVISCCVSSHDICHTGS